MAGKVIWKATVKANCNRDRVSSCAFIESPCVACDEWTVEEQISAVFPSFAGLLDAHVLLSEIESLTETLAGHAGEISLQQVACHFPSLPIAGLASSSGKWERREACACAGRWWGIRGPS